MGDARAVPERADANSKLVWLSDCPPGVVLLMYTFTKPELPGAIGVFGSKVIRKSARTGFDQRQSANASAEQPFRNITSSPHPNGSGDRSDRDRDNRAYEGNAGLASEPAACLGVELKLRTEQSA